MPRPPSEAPGRFSYRPCSRGARLSLFHLKLTDAALRALLAHQRLQGASRPVIAFQGSQGYLRVPWATHRSCYFTFFLSRYNKETPQASFDCVRQTLSRWGPSQLESKGAIQEKITICATVEPNQLGMWQRCHQQHMERDACKRAAPQQENGSPLPTKPGPHAPEGSRGKCGVSSPPCKPPVQPLALHLHRKSELLEQTGRAQPGLRDRLEALEEVGQLVPQERRSYSLKEELLRQVQEGWLDYTPQEQKQVAQLLRRRRAQQALARPSPAPSSPSGKASSGNGQALRAALEPRATRWQGPGFPGAQSSWWGRKLEPTATHSRGQPPGSGVRGESPSSEEETTVGEAEVQWEEEELQAQEHSFSAADKRSHGCAQEETPDYHLKYGPVRSLQQCQAYKAAFSADYTEYRQLHARVGSVSRRFALLGTRIRATQRGTAAYKVLAEQIRQEYRHFKKVHPNYQKEKQRCEYLHQKLSHIKGLILSFEQGLAPEGPAGQ